MLPSKTTAFFVPAQRKEKTVFLLVRTFLKTQLMGKMVGMARFELATSAPPVQRANQATLHPDQAAGIVVASAWFSMKKRIPRPSAWPSGYLASFFGSGGLGLTVSQR